jgi:hypothetical protein
MTVVTACQLKLNPVHRSNFRPPFSSIHVFYLHLAVHFLYFLPLRPGYFRSIPSLDTYTYYIIGPQFSSTMYTKALVVFVLLGLTSAWVIPDTTLTSRQAKACFVVGNTVLPQEVVDSVTSVQSSITCDPALKTLSGVPDVTSGTTSFSSIDFSKSNASPLQFSLDKFATATPLASTNLAAFQDMLNVYLATEAGIRSVDGNLAIKVPKFFLEMQISRIQTAQGNPPAAAGLQVDHLRDKVTKNAAGEDKALLDQVVQLAAVLA